MTDRRRLAIALLAVSGALAGHVIGTGVADLFGLGAGAVDHGHMSALIGAGAPLAALALCWMAVAGARNQLLAPRWRQLAALQIVLFGTQELIELAASGVGVAGLVTEPAILIGFAAQLLTSWLLVELVQLGEQLVHWWDASPPPASGRPADQLLPILVPVRSINSRSNVRRRGPPSR